MNLHFTNLDNGYLIAPSSWVAAGLRGYIETMIKWWQLLALTELKTKRTSRKNLSPK